MKVDDRSRSLSIAFKFFRHVEFKIESNRSSHAFIITSSFPVDRMVVKGRLKQLEEFCKDLVVNSATADQGSAISTVKQEPKS